MAGNAFRYEHVLELFRLHGYFLFLRGTFHGDLHPGNVLFEEGRFVFLDNANIETAPPALARGILDLLLALGDDDLPAAVEAMISTSTRPVSRSNRQALGEKMTDLYRGFLGKPVGEVSLTSQMMATVRARGLITGWPSPARPSRSSRAS